MKQMKEGKIDGSIIDTEDGVGVRGIGVTLRYRS